MSDCHVCVYLKELASRTVMYFFTLMFMVGLSNEKQQPLLDTTLERIKDEHYCIDVVIYLMNCGCTCSYTDMINLLFGVCAHGKLNVVKDLVEHHKVNPQGQFTVNLSH